MTAHTPGPWKWHRVQAPQSVTEYTLKGPDVLCRYWHDISQSHDALLIAAAPDLLEALESLLKFPDHGHSNAIDAWDKARAVISKAKGG